MNNKFDGEGLEGRLDVLLYKLINLGTKYLEQKHGLSGLHDSMKPFVEMGVKESIRKKAKLPNELMMVGRMLFRG